MENQDQWCFAWMVPDPVKEQSKAALLKEAKWIPGQVITVSFLDGDPNVQKKVKAVALAWTAPNLANLTLRFLDNPRAGDIRISFLREGSWSVIGTTALRVTNRDEPTMNYGWLTPASTDEEVRRVVLHEFGHALGLIHEHSHPQNGIQWNRDQVIADLSDQWDLATIEFNLFQPFSVEETNFSVFDPQSIMMYPIPARWTLNGFSTGLNTTLSSTDQIFIREQYP
jgi:serralysin